MTVSTHRPLLVTRDAGLRDDVHRLAAASGTALDVAHDLDEARPTWPHAPVVLVGADAVDPRAEPSPLRRDRLLVLSRGPAPDALFRGALALGAEAVVELPTAETWLVETLTDCADGARGKADLVAVVGATGGAGASTFAVALALAATSDTDPVTLVDADPLGCGLDLVAGLESVDGARWGSLMESAGRLGSRSLRAALPARGGLALLAWGPGPRTTLDASVVREVLSAASRGSALVVVDVPRYVDPVTAEVLARSDHLVLVGGQSMTAVAAAARMVPRLTTMVPRTLLVVRGEAGVGAEEMARTLALPLVAVMRDQHRLTETVELGLGPVRSRRGPLARAARAVLAEVRR